MVSSTFCARAFAWRHLPHAFPPWSTVHRWFLRLSQAGVFERLAHALTMADRVVQPVIERYAKQALWRDVMGGGQ